MRIRGIPHVSPSFVLLNVLFLLISLLGAGKAMIYMGPRISETDPLCPKNRPLETKHFHVNEPTNLPPAGTMAKFDTFSAEFVGAPTL
jgi:hypothetical protein